MTTDVPFRLAVLWSGDRVARTNATSANNRYARIFEELSALGIRAEPMVYADDMAAEVAEQLSTVDGVLVWVNPIFDGHNRAKLDELLRSATSNGTWVSAHPDVILKMGTKEILHWTRHLGWGTDTALYRDAKEFREAFPSRLKAAGPRVLKRNRGNGGQGVWKVELVSISQEPEVIVRVLEATRGSVPRDLPLDEFMDHCSSYFPGGGCIIDQPFQPRLPDGMIRCYMAGDRVVGFGHQLIKALVMPSRGEPPAEPGPRVMHPASAREFQALRTKMEIEWVPQMMKMLDIEPSSLPVIWDADFLHGRRTASGEDSYVLCEINVSCVFPVPDDAPAAIARLSLARLSARR